MLTLDPTLKRERKRTMGQKYERTGIFMMVIFFTGIIIGSLFSNTLDPAMNSDVAGVSTLVGSFIANINTNGLPSSYLLWSSLMTYGKQMLLIWAFGLFPITIPFIALLVGVQGFSYGFTTSFFMMEYNLKGLILCLGAYGVQGTMFVLMMFLLSTEAARFGRGHMTVSPKIYFMYLLVAIVGVSAVSVYETYVAPKVIQAIITRMF